jgi:hypothetical protein
MKELRIEETRFDGCYIMQEGNVNYVYNEKTDDLHAANSLELEYLKPRSRFELDRNDEFDNWRWTK